MPREPFTEGEAAQVALSVAAAAHALLVEYYEPPSVPVRIVVKVKRGDYEAAAVCVAVPAGQTVELDPNDALVDPKGNA